MGLIHRKRLYNKIYRGGMMEENKIHKGVRKKYENFFLTCAPEIINLKKDRWKRLLLKQSKLFAVH